MAPKWRTRGHCAYAITDYRTTAGLATRLMEASGATPRKAPSARGLLGRLFAGN